ncbi:UDP-3-O-(3-hydroxymyristoyl)glucosamine N-acyltransferase [Marinicella rhabdoformis]|uniref:UDP-3-O-(3-hydroxymyristoyl)glucosamine N-acyltransferase n=1 Tax=Marinicella rhabdoformis TaxID=2580566 RepID=UPI0012AEC26E|nr:UDP-3-O-(3-hydroxymyristoyl)glucosamine N-acyltransferase [Marinicella rhabdoformis]
MKSLAQIAASLELDFRGDGDYMLSSVGTLAASQPDQISFLANTKYTDQLRNTQAGAVILTTQDAVDYEGNVLLAPDAYVAFAKVAQLFAQADKKPANIHQQTAIDATVNLGVGVGVGAFSVIGPGCQIGAGCQIENNVTIAEGVILGDDCVIKSGVTVEAGCHLGDRVVIHPGAVIGADGFGLARDTKGWIKIPQTGVVIIGDDCEIGANTTVDCGAIENTVLGKDVRLDNQIQIGHNVHIGDHTVIAGCTAVAGSTQIGKNCLIGGGVGIVGHIKICDEVIVQAMSLVTHSIKKKGNYSAASPLQETKNWRKNAVRFRQLDQLARKVNQIEKKIK